MKKYIAGAVALASSTLVLATLFNNGYCVEIDEVLVPNPDNQFATITESPSNRAAANQAQSQFCHSVFAVENM